MMRTQLSVLILPLVLILVPCVYAAFLSVDRRARPSARPSDYPDLLNTNSKRLAAGLPPLPPIRKWSQNDMTAAKRSLPSHSIARRGTVRDFIGTIKVTNPATGSTLGFLGKSLVDDHYRLSTQSQAAVFSFRAESTETSYMLLIRDMDGAPSETYLEACINNSRNLRSDPPNTAVLTNSAAMTPSAHPGDSPESFLDALVGDACESAIWGYDPSSMAVTPQWVNYNLDVPPSWVMYDSTKDIFFIVVNPPRYMMSNPSAQVVVLTLVNDH
ncbi:uncharacterized protein EI90DRAFT_3075063 [Cantharellus anzutake]|uniref:uncharacterized protein n=1 Tax=Cantharellus anzutake TaxID=1750568 RepID=UPI00190886F6|nr:uncharacterized protein EI90DRAFT_3075063 [Cantharellus anzutake]KAF8324557.1 hypothetical protein EI90DRAFT_3075063 [Cantharellus anzutake]